MLKKISASRLKFLLRNVETVFCHKVATSADCDRLSMEVQRATSHLISSQTLRRIFRLVKSNTSSSLFTRNALSQYCGYEDWDQFCSEKKSSSINGEKNFATWVHDFYASPLPQHNYWPNYDYFIACMNVAKRIVADDVLYRTLPSQLASFRNGQILFFECFPYIDGLGNGYRKHLKVYLQNRATSYEAQIFANCLLFLGAYLTKNDKQMRHCYSVVSSIPCPSPGQMHEIPIARYLGVHILYNHYIGNHEEAKLWIEKSLTKFIPPDFTGSGFCNYQLVLSEHLFFAGYYNECIGLLKSCENIYWKNHFKKQPHDLRNYEAAKLMNAVSNLKLGNSKQGTSLFKEINPSAFFFANSKLYNLVYLNQQFSMCALNAKRKKNKILEQIDELVTQTRFVYFSPSNR